MCALLQEEHTSKYLCLFNDTEQTLLGIQQFHPEGGSGCALACCTSHNCAVCTATISSVFCIISVARIIARMLEKSFHISWPSHGEPGF